MNAIEQHADQLDDQLVDLLGCAVRNVRTQLRLVALADRGCSRRRATAGGDRSKCVQALDFVDRREQSRVDRGELHRRTRSHRHRRGRGKRAGIAEPRIERDGLSEK